MIDPRRAVIKKRLSAVKRIIVFASSKGGVGKSMISCTAALCLAQKEKTGLFDLDFQGASDHIILGASLDFPEEEGGILPSAVNNLKFMSTAYYTKDRPLSLRGEDITSAFLELFAVVIWKELDTLVIDMPPGIGDEILDVMHYFPGAEICLITAPSVISEKVVERFLVFLKNVDIKPGKIIQNHTFPGISSGKLACDIRIPFIEGLEECIGKPEKLLETPMAEILAADFL